jgi:hypothetical protein
MSGGSIQVNGVVGRIGRRDERRDRLGSRAGVALQRAQAGVAALGHEQR